MEAKGKQTDGWPHQQDRWSAPGTGHFSWCPTVGKALPRHCLVGLKDKNGLCQTKPPPFGCWRFHANVQIQWWSFWNGILVSRQGRWARSVLWNVVQLSGPCGHSWRTPAAVTAHLVTWQIKRCPTQAVSSLSVAYPMGGPRAIDFAAFFHDKTHLSFTMTPEWGFKGLESESHEFSSCTKRNPCNSSCLITSPLNI